MADLAPAIPQSSIPLEPLTQRKPPKRRLDSADKAQTIVANLWQASQQRNLQNAAIQGQFDGNPPYSPTKLRAAGRAGDANFNTLEAKSILSTALVPYYDLFAGATHFVDIRCEHGSPIERSRYSGILTEEFDRLLRRWRNYDYTMQSMLRDFIAFGKGYLLWESPKSWRVQKVAYYRILVPDATSIDVDELEMMVVLQDWPVAKLFAKIRNQQSAAQAGWDIDETLDAIASAVPKDPAAPNDPLAAQQMLKDSDIYVSARSSTVQTATIFVREFSGKWSELIVRRDQISSGSLTPQIDERAPRFMYRAFEKYERVQQLINPFFFEVLDGSWNGASGLGRDIFTIMQLKDRLACAQSNAVFLRNSLVLQPRQALDKSRMNLIQVGAQTWIPEGVEVLQSTILGDISSTIEVTRELTMMTERNTGIYRPTLEKTRGNPETLGEFQMKFAQATLLSTSAVNRFYAQLDRMYEEMYLRVTASDINESAGEWAKEAKEFQKRVKERGVPTEAMRKIESIRAWRNIGNGSVAMRQQTLQQFMAMYPLLPADGQQNLLEDVISVSSSRSQVERYMPETARQQLPTDDHAFAMLENAALKVGAPVSWSPSQNNIIHAQTHLQAGSQAAESLQAGANPADVAVFLDLLGAHIAVHLQRESQNPSSKEAVKVLTDQWKQLAQITDQIKGMVEASAKEQQKLQQQAQQVMTDADVKLMEVQMKAGISREKAMETLRLKAERQQAELALKAQAQGVDNALKDASTAADITRKTAQAEADRRAKEQQVQPANA